MPADIPPPPEPSPEGGSVFTLSSWQKRAAGACIDYVAPAIVIGIIGKASTSIYLLLQLAFFVFIMWNMVQQGNTGQTVGKGLVGIKLVREADAQVVGAGLSIGRYFLHIIDSLACFLGFLWPIWDAKRQTFSDKLLNTVVIDV